MKTRLNKQQWQALLAEQEQRGLSVAAFCREKNLTAKNFYNQRSNKNQQHDTAQYGTITYCTQNNAKTY